MAKVLACPSCGNKHPLDLLVGLDSFLCTNCGKKLAVPNEAMAVIKETVPPIPKIKEPRPVAKSEPTEYVEEPGSDDVVVLAHATINASEDIGVKKEKPAQDMPRSRVENPTKVQDQKPASVKESPRKDASSKSTGLLGSINQLASIPIPLIGRVAAWLFAIPFGFFIVVLLPRFFKRGFHASDFVGVITEPGIGRYGIVVTLIFFWSIATVVGVYLFNLALRKFFLSRKVAK